MQNKYYEAGARRAAKVGDLFGTIAGRYDLINDLQSFGLHRVWKRQLIRASQPRAGERALDLCCGTGDVAFALARRGVQAVGLDFSPPMLAVAERRRRTSRVAAATNEAPGMRKQAPRFVRADAQAIPFADDQFDIITISYGLRNLADWKLGLREMLRVARPGGRLLVLDFGKPENRFWRRIYFGYLRAGVPLFGRIFCGDPETHSYILASLEQYVAQEGVAEGMRELGCSEVRVDNLLGGIMSINYGRKPR